MMTPDQFTEMLNRLHLSQVQLARQIKATPRAVNYWAAGSRKIPGSVEAYLRVLDQSPKSLRDLERDSPTPSKAMSPMELQSRWLAKVLAQRDALKQVIDRLTSDEAVESAQEAYDKASERYGLDYVSDGDCIIEALTAAIRAASGNEGGVGS